MNAVESSALTVDYIRSSLLSICYTDYEIQTLIDRVNAGESRVDVLLSIPRMEAVRVLCGLASREVLIEVSNCCARRAKEYATANAAAAAYAAAAANAANAADYATANAATAAYAAVYATANAAAAAYAADYAAANAYTAELGITIRHLCMLMGW
jgi:hypothetical protein